MNREEMIRKARNAKSPEELVEIAKGSGVGGITGENAGKLYARINSSHELADEELDVSAGGCFLFNGMVCPSCNKAVGFRTVSTDENANAATIKCEGCGNVITVSLSSI